MNVFEQPIPKKPTEAGSTYFEDKKDEALLKFEQEQIAKEETKAEAFAPFDKPIEEAFDEKNGNSEELMPRYKEKLLQVIDLMNDSKREYNRLEVLQKEGKLDQNDYYKMYLLEQSITEKQTVLEDIMKNFSPKDFEDDAETSYDKVH